MRVWHLLVATIPFALVFAFFRLVGEMALYTAGGLLIVLCTALLYGYSTDIRQILRRWRRRADRMTGLNGAMARFAAWGASGVFVFTAAVWFVIAVVTTVFVLVSLIPEFYQPVS